MLRRWLITLAAAAGLVGALSGDAGAAVARNDAVRAQLVPTKNGGYKVVLVFRDLLRNDKLTYSIKGRKVMPAPNQPGVKSVALKGGGKQGQRRVVVRFTKAFLRKVLASGKAQTSFVYRIVDSCRKARCGGPSDRARVRLTVVSPS